MLPSRPSQVLFLVACTVGGAAVGVPGGWLWASLAGPPSAELTSDGAIFGEAQLDRQVGVTLWFAVLGAALGLLVGVAVAWRRSRYGVGAVFAVVLACVAASLVSYLTGVHVFGPDASAQLAEARVGQRVTAPVGLGTKIAYLGWPLGGLTGALFAICWWPRNLVEMPAAALRSSLSSH